VTETGPTGPPGPQDGDAPTQTQRGTDPADRETPPQEVLVITGMSGAGRSTVGDVLEDLGWYVVDNLPPQMMCALVETTHARGTQLPRIAVAVDVRGWTSFETLDRAMVDLQKAGVRTHLLFLDAVDDTLVRRYESVRRPHPLQDDGRILDGLTRERAALAELRGTAETVIDTSYLNVHQLSAKVTEAYGDRAGPLLRLTVMSFGFKYGLPLDADHVVDVRFLPNPFWVPELRPRTGLDPSVSDYVLERPGAMEFLENYLRALRPVLAGYTRENKKYATLAIGCTGGKHRSVAIGEALAARLRSESVSASTVHRDMGRE
jgi:RNase adapter protein RapZ